MPSLVRPVDMSRASRAILAYIDSDKPAYDYVLQEAAADEPRGTAGIFLAVVQLAAITGIEYVGNYILGLRAGLLDYEKNHDDSGKSSPDE